MTIMFDLQINLQ